MLFQIPQPAPQTQQGATNQQTYIFPVSQPELIHFNQLQQNRFIVDAVRYFDGATKLDFAPIQGAVMEYQRQYQFPAPKPPILGPTVVAQQTYIFPLSQPELRYYVHNTFSDVELPILGAINQQTVPIPPVSNPEFSYYKPEVNRYTDELVKRIEGATIQQTYIFPLSQPEFRYYLHNTFSDVFRPIEGATIQQTYIFPLGQPSGQYYVRNTFSEVRFPIPGVTVIPPQTYIFPLLQPEFRYYVYNTYSGNLVRFDIGGHVAVTGQPLLTLMGVGM